MERQRSSVSEKSKILVVDDTPHNVKLLADLLAVKGYDVSTAASGAEAMELLPQFGPDIVLLDVMMPGMSGYEVCQKIRKNPETRLLPVIMVTALDAAEERIKGIEAGADDFLSKPINTVELLARVHSLLQIRELHETVQTQAVELAEWNEKLEQRVAEQVGTLQRLERLKRFFSPQLAEAISNQGMKLLEPHRRKVTVVFLDLRGFTQFAESAEPEEMMDMLREYHGEMGRLIMQHEGTLERFTGDGLMIFFNDPVEVPDAEERAVRMAVGMKESIGKLGEQWSRLGWNLGFGIGITTGYATLGAIGFEERWDYAAIGTVTNLAARLCSDAEDGQILVTDRLIAKIEDMVDSVSMGEYSLKGFRESVQVHNVLAIRS